MEITIGDKKYKARKLSWKDEFSLEEKNKLSVKAKRLEYYNTYLDKVSDDMEKSLEVLDKLSQAENDYYSAVLENDIDTIKKSIDISDEEIDKLTVKDIMSAANMIRAYSSSLLDDITVIDVVEIVRDYAISKSDQELLDLIDNIEEKHFSVKKK